jgi:hypothetical protein
MVSANSAVYAQYCEVGVPLLGPEVVCRNILEIFAPSVRIILLQNVKLGWWLCGHFLYLLFVGNNEPLELRI